MPLEVMQHCEGSPRRGFYRTSELLVFLLFALPTLALGQPTFEEDIAPLFERHCNFCHTDGGSAPFSLNTYDQVRPRGRQILNVVERGTMPPWLPAGEGIFEGERRVPEADRELLWRWVQAGMPRGALDSRRNDRGARQEVTGPRDAATPVWKLGPPDLVLEMPEAYPLEASGPDVFRNFVLPLPESFAGQWIRSVEIVPLTPQAIHHAVLTVDTTDSSRRLDARDASPGFSGMEPLSQATSPGGQFLGWTPGKLPFAGYPGTAWRLEANADLVLLLHLLPTGVEESVRARVGLSFADAPPTVELHTLRLTSKTLDIPAGEAHYATSDSFTLPVSVSLLSIYPHAHYLATEMVGTAFLPNGEQIDLLTIPHWDFHWQDQYRYRQPPELPAGTRLEMRYVYDNSASNPANPHRPPVRVRYGPSSLDEMGDLWLELLPRNPAELGRLEQASRRHELLSREEGFLAALAHTPNDLEARFNLAETLHQLGRFEEEVEELRSLLDTAPETAKAHTNLGNTLLILGDEANALTHLERAATLEPKSPEASFNLANALARRGRLEEALERYDQSLALRPVYPAAHLNRGIALSRLGRHEEEIAAYRRALEEDPAYAQAHYNLALALARQGQLVPALLAIEKARDLAPLPPVLTVRARLLRTAGRKNEAVVAYQELLRREPQWAAGHAELAELLLALDRRSEARDALARALKIDPQQPLARTLMEHFEKAP